MNRSNHRRRARARPPRGAANDVAITAGACLIGCVVVRLVASPAAAKDHAPVDWRWRRFQPFDNRHRARYSVRSPLRRWQPGNPDRNWQGGILFDDWMRERSAIYSVEHQDCAENSTARNRSFYAGHPAVGMTAAGLTCVLHANLKLYGGGAADTLACGATVGAAVMNGIGRVLTEKHWASDLVVGFGVGAAAGFVLPQLLHYAHRLDTTAKTAQRDARRASVRAALVPMVSDRQLGIQVHGAFQRAACNGPSDESTGTAATTTSCTCAIVAAPR